MRCLPVPAACLVLAAAALCAQPPGGDAAAPPALHNTGEPMRLEYVCTDQDVTAAGLECTAEKPCAVYLELAAVEAAGTRIFAAGNIHTGSATLRSVLLMSPDLGKSWTEPFERIGGATIDHLYFFDEETGWAAGQLVQPLPRDPFILVTTDGGANWRRRPVFSEPGSGAIDHFVFASRTDGSLWIDRSHSGEEGARFERWETTTGGEVWMLREALNRPPPAPPARTSQWRLRADASSGSYLIERRPGDRWERVAAFLIELGECRPALNPVPEPPSEPAPPPAAGQPGRGSADRYRSLAQNADQVGS